MHDGLYENQDRLGTPLLFSLAGTLGLSEAELRDALATDKYAPKVKSDFLGGVHSGVNGTPSFFINRRLREGTYEFSDLMSAIGSHLSTQREFIRRHQPAKGEQCHDLCYERYSADNGDNSLAQRAPNRCRFCSAVGRYPSRPRPPLG
jgi:hypothetical protein